MKLDKRIKRGKKPLTPLDTEKAYEFIGKLCLFANYASYFENFDLVDPRADFYNPHKTPHLYDVGFNAIKNKKYLTCKYI